MKLCQRLFCGSIRRYDEQDSTSLLEPALDDLERMASDHREAKSMVGAAVSKLVSGCDDAST